MSFPNPSEIQRNIVAFIEAFVEGSPHNTLQNQEGDRAFEAPLVGFSRGDDPLYGLYKEVVGPFHWRPEEAFALAHPGLSRRSGELTVVSWILPHIGATKADNRRRRRFPSERWARGRIFGEEVNNALRRALVRRLKEMGVEAVAPVLLPQWERVISPRFFYASTWSERHAAYASGLGTFGLCDGLITPRGKAIRAGSLVVGATLPATPRPYDDQHAYCLFYTHQTCGKCISRCPVGALSPEGHDKERCLRHIREATVPYVRRNFGFEGYGCGLCQTGVPCESGIPRPEDG